MSEQDLPLRPQANSSKTDPAFVDEDVHLPPRRPITSHQPELVLDEYDAPMAQKRRTRTLRQVWLPSSWAFVKTTFVATLAGLLIATVFSYWTPEDDLLPEHFRSQMQSVSTTAQPPRSFVTPLPTDVPTQRIGIIAGHSGPLQDPSLVGIADPGAVCDDNNDGIPELTELEINEEVARLVVDELILRGYEVDLLGEFDPRLEGYRGSALISIHTNDCRNYGLGATGYNVVGAFSRGIERGLDEILVRCMINEYGAATGLPRHFGVTDDMTLYHTFDEVAFDTPTAIIEIAFMFADRQFLVNNRPTIARGIVDGILCFLEPQ